MKKNFFMTIVLLAAVVLPLGFASCSANDNPVEDPDEQDITEAVIIDAWDAPRFFLHAIATCDQEGNNFESFAWGEELYPNTDPGHLYIGVDTFDEAEQIFRRWLAPNVNPGLIPPSDKALKCPLPDLKGIPQMEVYLKPGETDDVVAEVTVSDESKLKHFYKITFLKNSAWPTNDDETTWEVGDIVKNVKLTSDNNIEDKLNDKDKRLDFVCIRKSGNGIKPWFITVTKHEDYVCGGTIERPTYKRIRMSYWTPDEDTANEIQSLMSENWSLIESEFEDADCGTLSEGRYYWIDRCHKSKSHLFDEMKYSTGALQGHSKNTSGTFLLNFNNYSAEDVYDDCTVWRSARSSYSTSDGHTTH